MTVLRSLIRSVRRCSEVERIQLMRLLPIWVEKHRSPRHTILRRKFTLKRRIATLAEDGMLLVIESGRDCDGVEYSGCWHLIPATLEAFYELEDHVRANAEGPWRLELDRPSNQIQYVYHERDRVLEAFEDGHAWCI